MSQYVIRTRWTRIAGAVLLLMLPSTVWAGWGPAWHSLTAASPNGQYVLDATIDKSPHFAYRLHDRAGKTLWQREARPDEDLPSAVFVADDAWSVLWLRFDNGEVLIVKPDGTHAARLNVFADLLTTEERQRRVQHTSGGSNFGNRYSYVVTDHGASYFVMRTFWDRRVVVDLRHGRLIKAPAALGSVLDCEEREHVLSALTQASNGKGLEKLKWPQTESIFMAIHMAGRLKVREAVPLLRAIEAEPCRTGSFIADEFAQDGAYFWEQHEFRRGAQTALRKIGERPRPLPGMTLDELPAHAEPSWLKMPPKPREQQVAELRTGLAPQEAIRLLGPPDDANSEQQWRYDMDAERPFTLILLWQQGKVKEIIKETRPLWETEDRCDGDCFREWWYDKEAVKSDGQRR